MTHRYTAPFSSKGSAPIDAAIAERLLAVALSRGGDYADLFFEYEVSGSYGYEEGILKSAGRGVSLGLGVRVRKGDATGYAYCEDLAIEAMEHAAKIAAQIADAGGNKPVGLQPISTPSRYPVTVRPSASCSAASTWRPARSIRASRAWRRRSPSRSARSSSQRAMERSSPTASRSCASACA
jgi:TldD protein